MKLTIHYPDQPDIVLLTPEEKALEVGDRHYREVLGSDKYQEFRVVEQKTYMEYIGSVIGDWDDDTNWSKVREVVLVATGAFKIFDNKKQEWVRYGA